MKNLGIYVHIPFCLKKCFYCDFYSEADADEKRQSQYVEALKREIDFYGRQYDREYQADTVFIGGGTPSILDGTLIGQILSTMKSYFPLDDDAEITIESNPATLSEEKLELYKEAGINRISIGAQSFSNECLERLGRVHRAQQTIETVAMARRQGFSNLNLDVMFGLPDQDESIWRETVDTLLDIKPEHLSFYSLELSEGTKFYEWYKLGKLQLTTIEKDRRMYRQILHDIKKAGYLQYEISNAALAGFECRHNIKYWNLDEYLGLGASAHSYIRGLRYANVADAARYVAAMTEEGGLCLEGQGHNQRLSRATADWHQNTCRDDMTDFTFTALRRNKGIDLAEFSNRFNVEFWDAFGEQRQAFRDFVEQGYGEDNEKAIRITEAGFDIANRIIQLFV